MTVCRTHRTNNFFIISNVTAQNPDLSFEALGMLTYCLSMPPNWEFHPKTLWKQRDCGRDKIYKKFNELIKNYHCIRIRLPNPKFPNLPGEIEYEFYDDVNDCKHRIKELEKTKLSFEHGGNLKLSLRNPEKQDPTEKDPVNQVIIKDTLYTNNNNNINCADKVVAPVKKKPKEKKEKTPTNIRLDHDIPELRIETSDEDHHKLVAKFGNSFTQECYNYLQQWKISKWESDPKPFPSHTDYFRIIKWVSKEIKKLEERPTTKKSNLEKVKEKFKHYGVYNGATCYITEDAIAFERGINNISVKFKELGFDDQFSNMLIKFNIKI